MTEVRLGDPKVAEVSAGQAAPQNMQSFGKSGHPFIRAGSLEFLCSGGSICELEHIEPSVAAEHRLKLFPKHTVVFAKSGMSAKIGRVYRLAEPSYVVSHLAAITPKEKLDSSYLLYFLQANPPAKLIPNDAYPSIRLSEIENIIVQLPLLEEQRRIAAILDKADAIRRKRQQSLKLADDWVKSQFIEMFGDPGTNPMGWERGTIRDIAADVRYGTSKPASENGKYAYLRMNNITYGGELDLSDLKSIDVPDNEVEKYIVRNGDVLFNRTNSKELVGKTCVFNSDTPMIIAGYIIRVRVNHRATPTYLSAFLNSDYGKLTLRSMCKSIIGQANINAQELQDIKISIPPLELQNQFARFVEQADKSKFVMQNQLSEIEILLSALKQKFFA